MLILGPANEWFVHPPYLLGQRLYNTTNASINDSPTLILVNAFLTQLVDDSFRNLHFALDICGTLVVTETRS